MDRATQRRADAEWIEAAWADPRTRVVVVHASQALGRTVDGQPELVFVSAAEAPEGTRFFLGVDDDEVAYFGVSAAAEAEAWAWSAEPDAKPISLRLAGALLSDRDAGLLTHAIALANWHDTHTHCPQCGAATIPAPAGHLTVCPVDGTEHFPRLDPAVIMLVTDPDDRLPAGAERAVAEGPDVGPGRVRRARASRPSTRSCARSSRRPRSSSARSATWAASRGRCRAA